MHRFYLPPEQCTEGVAELSGREAHHALHVLRVRRGDRVQLLNGAGQERLCAVKDYDRERVRLEIIETRFVPPFPYRITLLQALPKGKRIDTVIQKATELGAARIVPLLSERVVAQLDQEDSASKVAKWRQVAVEAIKQCGSPWLPQIDPAITPREFLARGDRSELSLVGSLQANAKHPRECFQSFRRSHGRMPNSVAIWIGPEGDFSSAELDLLQAADVLPVTLGPLVLRTDTAAIYCLSILNYEFQAPTAADLV